jgi:molybdate transport system substrate-binding protein
MANPKLAPYGLAAIQVLRYLQMDNGKQSKWIQGENVSQVYQFVHSGNADLGFVALSQVLNQGAAQEQYWLIPETFYQPIKQDVVWLQRAKDNPAAKALWDFVQSEKAKAMINQQGYRMLQVTTL